MTEIFVFGDSITYGKWDAEKGGWVNRLNLDFDKKVIDSHFEEYFALYNLGIPGDTTQTLLHRFDSEIGTRYKEKGACVILIAIGINDVQHFENENLTVSIEQSEENIRSILSIAKEYANTIIVLGPTCVDETRMLPCVWLDNVNYKNSDIQQYDTMLQTVCEQESISYVHLFDTLTNELLIDGIHPNAQGHEKLYTIIKKVLEEKRII